MEFFLAEKLDCRIFLTILFAVFFPPIACLTLNVLDKKKAILKLVDTTFSHGPATLLSVFAWLLQARYDFL